MKNETLLITGGAGLIRSVVIRYLIEETEHTVVNIDKLTYVGNLDSLLPVAANPRYHFKQADIGDAEAIRNIFSYYKPSAIMYFAAESHVDRSIEGPSEFIQTNIVGTCTLLKVARDYWSGLNEEQQQRFRFHHVSTDEAYGSPGETGLFTEELCYEPNSPYSASKASSDHRVRAWHETYGLPIVITNCSNNYGPYQFHEKLVPLKATVELALKHSELNDDFQEYLDANVVHVNRIDLMNWGASVV